MNDADALDEVLIRFGIVDCLLPENYESLRVALSQYVAQARREEYDHLLETVTEGGL